MSNAVLPVIVGLTVGVLLIVAMIFVSKSFTIHDNTGVFIIDNSGNELNEDPYGLLEENNNRMGAIVLGGPDNVDSGTDQVLPSITFDDGVILTLK